MAVLFIFFSIFLTIFPLTSPNPDSEALLKLKQSFTQTNILDSWRPGTEPCAENDHWVGILCQNGAVFGIRLGYMGLSGTIDIDALSSLSGLRSVAFMSNSFSGPIPDFHKMGALKGLYLSANHFSGPIPSDYFAKMWNLKKVWFSRNNFSGPIPSSLSQLSQLMELHLADNKFSGRIPNLPQKSLVSLDLANNDLEGEIPPSLSRFGPNMFDDNPRLCGGSSGRACDLSNNPGNSALKIVVWVLVLVAAVLLLAVFAVFGMRRRHRSQSYNASVKENDSENPISMEATSKEIGLSSSSSTKGVGSGRKGGKDVEIINDEKGEFRLVDLMKAAAEVLGNGVLGSTYKATMTSGLIVVVKRTKEMNKIGRDRFDSEMRRLGSLRHKNVLTPLGYHYRKDEKLLVSEYQHTGSLMFLLHDDRGISHSRLNWPVRLKIIQGIARGLAYLHAELSSLDLPHGNLKSSNVLLTPNYEPLLADYGFSSLISPNQAAQVLVAYKSPEAMLHQIISPKCDVYCLGIIILEILTGKFHSQYMKNDQGGTDLVQWVRSTIVEGQQADLLDPNIVNTEGFLEEMEQLIYIAAACTESNPDQRLDLLEVVRRIEGIGAGGSGSGSSQETKTFQILSSLSERYGD